MTTESKTRRSGCSYERNPVEGSREIPANVGCAHAVSVQENTLDHSDRSLGSGIDVDLGSPELAHARRGDGSAPLWSIDRIWSHKRGTDCRRIPPLTDRRRTGLQTPCTVRHQDGSCVVLGAQGSSKRRSGAAGGWRKVCF